MSQNVNAVFVLYRVCLFSIHSFGCALCECRFFLYAVSSSHNLVFYLHTNRVSCKRWIQQRKKKNTSNRKKWQNTQSRKSKWFRAKWRELTKKKSSGSMRYFFLLPFCVSRAAYIYDRVYINRTLHIPCRLHCYRESACFCLYLLFYEWINYVYGTSAQSI